MSVRATAKSHPSGSERDPIRIFLADRDPLFLHGVESVLHSSGDWKVTGKSGTVRALIEHPRLPESGVLLSGLFLRCGRFLSVTIPDILKNNPKLKVILLVNETEIGLWSGPRKLSRFE
jgi:DNA-binding NarL/FixJ family response regulator